MEFRLILSVCGGDTLPVNYQYPISSWIYRVIGQADVGYADFLHRGGFQHDWRHFKMFTFSQLDARPYRVFGNRMRLLGKEISLTVRFAVDSSMEHFITGLFLQQRLSLGDRYNRVDLEVTRVESIAPPVFSETMTYRCLSPICVSRTRANRTTEYLTPEVSDYGELLVRNLVHKAAALVPAGDAISGDFPEFQFRLLNTPRKKGIHVKDYSESHTQLIGYLFHFELTAPVELHELGYEAGFGEKNSMGFGCVEAVQKPSNT
jgi:CRISPR-associated endoribonuclease Cas6